MQSVVPVQKRSLASFLEQLNDQLDTYSVITTDALKSITDILHSLLDPYAIKFSHDARSGWEHVRHMREAHPELGIPNRIRVVLKTRRNKGDFRHELVRLCNGLVIAIEETDAGLKARTLALPVKEVCQSFQRTKVEFFLQQCKYNIYPIRDGTVLNLYYDDGHYHEVSDASGTRVVKGKWLYGSRNSFNVEGISWRGYPYAKVLSQLRACYPDFKEANLDVKRTYTIGIRHPAFHPFNQPAEWVDSANFEESGMAWKREMWLIDTSESRASEVQPNIGIPVQQPINLELSLSNIQKFSNISLEVFLGNANRGGRGNAPNPGELPAGCETFIGTDRPIFLGYILRLKPNATDDPDCVAQDVIIESRLWTEIRNMVYESPSTSTRDKSSKATYFRDVQYMVLHNYMNRSKLPYFLKILPQYYHLYRQQDERVRCVLELVYEILSGVAPPEGITKELGEMRIRYRGLAERLVPIIRSKYEVTRAPHANKKSVATDKGMIHDLLVHVLYLDTFYEGMYGVHV